jgi:Sulfotransferase domain
MTPNLFILGAGKSGTTTLYDILGQHEDIHTSKVKEPSFFCSYFQVVRDPISYFRLFDSAKRYRVDKSHVYFSNPETARVLRALFPDAKFIVILRHPKNRAYSLYRQMRGIQHEDDGQPLEEIADFAGALRAEAGRFASAEFFAGCRQYFWNFMYCRSSFYDRQLGRYFELFDRRQFHVLTLAELAADPLAASERIIAFLGLDPTALPRFSFPVSNARGAFEPYTPYCSESSDLMDETFAGLIERTEGLLGRPLDWSL